MCRLPTDTIEVSGRWTIAPTDTSPSPWLRASSTCGSYEIAMSTFPAASSCSGDAGFGGVSTWTSSPAFAKSPSASASYRPTWSAFGTQSSITVIDCDVPGPS